MMLRYSLGMTAEAERIERAVQKVLTQGYRTVDIFTPGTTQLGTHEMGVAVVQALS